MNTQTKEIGLSFGAMSESFRKQLKAQGFKYDEETVRHFELDGDAINRLRIRGYLTHSGTDSATKKLFNKITAHVKKQNQ